jgi:DNA-directed RNA polymerase subunit RPC12/RpoP
MEGGNSLIYCVECGHAFYAEDADNVSYATSSVACPECGRSNFCEDVEMDGFSVESIFDDAVEDTDEIYIEGYMSKDLEYDGENKNEKQKQRRIGIAKQKRSIPRIPMFESRKAIAEILMSEQDNMDEATKRELEELYKDEYADEEYEQ